MLLLLTPTSTRPCKSRRSFHSWAVGIRRHARFLLRTGNATQSQLCLHSHVAPQAEFGRLGIPSRAASKDVGFAGLAKQRLPGDGCCFCSDWLGIPRSSSGIAAGERLEQGGSTAPHNPPYRSGRNGAKLTDTNQRTIRTEFLPWTQRQYRTRQNRG